ncbi:MAG: hypothetical protein KIG96_12210, partial [Treponema sp.]|nr:hypothetical protein [Treponema sp.]
LSIASLLAMILSVAIFTSCSEPEPYTGKFYNTEYVTNITEDDYNKNWEKANSKTAIRELLATYSSKDGYEKKTNLKDYEVVSYIKSKSNITDDKVQADLLLLENTYSYILYVITDEKPGSTHNILFLTKAE